MSEINIIVAFSGGLVSFFAPCVVPLIPAYVGYVSGVSLYELRRKENITLFRRQLLFSSLFYILGFSLVFIILGTTSALIGSLFREYNNYIQQIGGILIMLFALHFIGIIRVPDLGFRWQLRLPDWSEHLGYGRSFIIGVVFATAWTPCVGAVLGAILTLAAISETAVTGALMLFIYSLGISLPFLIISLVISQIPDILDSVKRHLRTLNIIAGVMLFAIGFLLFNNSLGWISSLLTYNRLNSLIFDIAFDLGYEIR